VVLLGYQGYPTPVEGNQIKRVRLAVERFKAQPNVTIGFADHALPDSTLRYSLAAMAVGAGAKVLEKHLTLGRIMKIEDHEAALNPDEFLEFSQTIRGCETALGEASDTEDFGMSESEKGYRTMIRRHVVAARDLKAGAVIAPEDVILKRTAAAEPVTDLNVAYDRTLKRDVPQNCPVTTDSL
jgi:N,N'-diacetyllegionaminate synthase